jgi:ATP:ADP antiporter, AAA family
MIGVTGLGFFGLTLVPGSVAPLAKLFGTTPLMLAVIVGAMQNILSKSAKYSLFDPCKEMAYIRKFFQCAPREHIKRSV